MTDSEMRLQLPTDRLLLEELAKRRDLGANIAEDIDRHRKTATERLNQLEDYGLVVGERRGVYEITPTGVATLKLIEEYDPSDEFEARVEERAKQIEIVPQQIIDHAEEDES